MAGHVDIWRIAPDTPHYEANDMRGGGAELSGGRWNRKGTPMVYASSTRALACLETVVHLAGGIPLPLNRYLVRIRVAATIWSRRRVLDPTQLVGWDAEPAGKASIDWGSRWASENKTCIAEVPSVLVPEESNILINPRHPDAGGIHAVKMRRWTYDSRLR